jgi:hypothetical protein
MPCSAYSRPGGPNKDTQDAPAHELSRNTYKVGLRHWQTWDRWASWPISGNTLPRLPTCCCRLEASLSEFFGA